MSAFAPVHLESGASSADHTSGAAAVGGVLTGKPRSPM
jgi:hypothetical protein